MRKNASDSDATSKGKERPRPGKIHRVRTIPGSQEIIGGEEPKQTSFLSTVVGGGKKGGVGAAGWELDLNVTLGKIKVGGWKTFWRLHTLRHDR